MKGSLWGLIIFKKKKKTRIIHFSRLKSCCLLLRCRKSNYGISFVRERWLIFILNAEYPELLFICSFSFPRLYWNIAVLLCTQINAVF